MPVCLICHLPLGSGELLAVLRGRIDYGDTGDFIASTSEGYICADCFDGIDEPEEVMRSIKVGDITYRAKE